MNSPLPATKTPSTSTNFAQFVTGATGFVGGALVLELLQRTSDVIVCLVRPGEQDPQQRLWQAIDAACDAYDAPSELREVARERVVAVAGDVEQTMCGVSLARIPQLRYRSFWHSAASLRFEDRYVEQIMAINVAGTRHALALASELGVLDFNSMSTAYVVGQAKGVMLEERQNGSPPNNLYEKSKIEAEEMILAAKHFAVRIFRPSIVIGHSRTYGATNFTGMYGLLRQLFNFESMMARTQEDFLQNESLRLRVDVGSAVDLVPVDRVVANAVSVWLATQDNVKAGHAEFYHLNNPTPPTIDGLLNLMFSMIGIKSPIFLTNDEQMGEMQWLDEKFNSRIEFYRSYFRNHKVFDRQNLTSIVGAEDPSYYAMDDEVLRKYCDWYMQKLLLERANMPSTR